MTIEFDGQNNKLGTTTADSVTIKTNDTDAVTIDTSQRVGINQSSPSSQLHILGSNATTQFKIEHSSASNAVLIGEDSSSNLRIYTGGTERIRVDSSGHAIIPQGVTLGTTAGTYSASNTLDDYEEGTFTPTAEFAATQPTAGATSGTGFYTKVGDMVTVWGTVENFNVTGASGDLRVRNLPFSARLSTPLGGFQGTAQLSNINYADDCYVTAEVPDDLTYVRFAENRDNAARDFINKDNCSHGASDVYFCVTYKTD